MLKNNGDAEVTNLDLVSLSHEYVLRFQVPMQNLPIVDVLYSKSHLYEPIKDLIFSVHH
jgi:hypothetical protein